MIGQVSETKIGPLNMIGIAGKGIRITWDGWKRIGGLPVIPPQRSQKDDPNKIGLYSHCILIAGTG